ncbi:MAG TPA: ABC transporter ATP-binding protein [Desulfobacteraceae bacterium]|nr:ABC transporter ATP-binding protein [Deltaproteobacteria bacterium]HDI58920.1 ABC transporter ATP-binding protein [Desulfobacteraceae bacterium]
METAPEPLVRLEGIDKRFGAVHANRRIDLKINSGRIKALLGENGAGKSTLMNILAGRIKPDGGRIHIGAAVHAHLTPRRAIAAGIGMVYQHFTLVDALTVAENVCLGQAAGIWHHPRRSQEQVARLAAAVGLDIDPGATVAGLSMGERQRVEILKLLYRRSRILIFDEPTSVLTPPEIRQLFSALRQMADQGKAIVFISHKLGEVLEIADEIAILRHGQIIDERPAKAFGAREELARRMIGRDVLLEIDRPVVELRQPVLQVEQLDGGGLQQISFQLRQGEILALVGVAGNGQSAMVRTICGLAAPVAGVVRLLGQPWADFFSGAASGLVYIPEDRVGLATCHHLDLVDNFLLTTRRRFCKGPWLQRASATACLEALMVDFDIRPADARLRARQLSGGNLQKLVLAREFHRRPKLIVAEQPTQGLDIGATEDVWRLLLKAREEAGILLVTSDLNEALALADRLAVMYRGRIVDLFSVFDKEKLARIGQMMAGID